MCYVQKLTCVEGYAWGSPKVSINHIVEERKHDFFWSLCKCDVLKDDLQKNVKHTENGDADGEGAIKMHVVLD